jgi:hypothetical protein
MDNDDMRIEELLQLMEAIDKDELIWLEQEITAIYELKTQTEGTSK